MATALLCGGCGGDKQTVEQADPGIAVEVVQAELGQIVNSTVVRGNVEATDDVYVAPKAQGVVRSVNVSVVIISAMVRLFASWTLWICKRRWLWLKANMTH